MVHRILPIFPIQFSSVVSDSLQPHESQHARALCPSPTPAFIQTHVHWVGDAVQPSHPLSTPSPPALNPSQHQSLSQWVNSSHEVAKVLEFQPQHQSFWWTPRTGLLYDRRLTRVFSSTTVQKHQFFGAQPSLWSNSHMHSWLLEKP